MMAIMEPFLAILEPKLAVRNPPKPVQNACQVVVQAKYRVRWLLNTWKTWRGRLEMGWVGFHTVSTPKSVGFGTLHILAPSGAKRPKMA